MSRVVHEATLLIPAAEGAVIELATNGMLTYVSAAGTLAPHTGVTLRPDQSLSGLSISLGETLRCDDATTDARVDAAMCRRVGAISMICVPLQRGDRFIGVLKVVSSSPRAFNERDTRTLSRLAEFVTWVVSAAADLDAILPGLSGAGEGERVVAPGLPEDEDRRRQAVHRFVENILRPRSAAAPDVRARIGSVIERGGPSMVLQPIVDLESGTLAGAEALARFAGPPDQPPDLWFGEAEAVGRGAELELSAVRAAIGFLGQLPARSYLAVNVGPEAARLLSASGLLDGVPAGRLVVELTEHVQVRSYPVLTTELGLLRERGVRIAIDDTGTGYSTFDHILRLAPEIIKLDRSLTAAIDIDPIRRSLAGALATFAGETGASVVAEGIETPGELEAILDLGIRYGQGFLLARPAPLIPAFDAWPTRTTT